jgi:glycosyltransferase involved in cell wall biosynthesis
VGGGTSARATDGDSSGAANRALGDDRTTPASTPNEVAAEQAHLEIRPAGLPQGHLASIIVPCCNQLEFTRQCFRALVRHTRGPWELIVVDNGSSDGTAAYLAGAQDLAAVAVTVVTNAQNLRFPAAINQGLQVARGEFLVLLNNDVVVTDAWLDQLIALTCARTSVGDRGEKPEKDLTAKDAKSAKKSSDLDAIAADIAQCSQAGSLVGGSSGAAVMGGPDGRGRAEKTIGLTGPMTNYASPPQLVERVPYGDMEQMHAFAARWREERRGQWMTVGKLSGFCLLMTRAVYEKVGGLNERFGIGFFDDDDLAERARRAGFELAVAHDMFVHHFGSRTFAGSGIDTEALLNENQRRFAAKWGLGHVCGRRVALRPFGAKTPNGHRDESSPAPAIRVPSKGLRTTDQGLGEHDVRSNDPCPSVQSVVKNLRMSVVSSPRRRRSKVSLTMIVKNEQDNLPQALESVAGLPDEIVIVDTGSTDRTKEIARSFGANVFEFPWVDSFSAARNEALRRATGDYAFWIDADDVVDPDERVKLEELFDQLPAPGRRRPTPPDELTAFVIRCACDPSPDGSGGNTVVDHVRLFPIRDDVRWTYRVHEQILPSIKASGIPVRFTGINVRHTGYTDPVKRATKLDRDLRLCYLDLADHPDEPFIMFTIGAISVERCEWDIALKFLRRSLERSAPTDSITRKLFALIARVHQAVGDSGEALRTCRAGLVLDPQDAELLFRKAIIHRHRGESNEAEQSWRQILTLRRPDQFASLDQGIFGHLPRRNLAVLAEERGDLAEAGLLWKEVLTECPREPDAVWSTHRLAGPVSPGQVRWLIPGSQRSVLPVRGPGDFDPYLPTAFNWVRALSAKVVVELGVRAGSSTRALLAGVAETGGQVWGIDLQNIHGIDDPRLHFIQADAASVADRWPAIDLLHIDTDPHTEEQTRRWFDLYAHRCRAIALHDTHHPAFGVGTAVREFVETGEWNVFEYWGNPSGWTVLTRPGEPCRPADAGIANLGSGPFPGIRAT